MRPSRIRASAMAPAVAMRSNVNGDVCSEPSTPTSTAPMALPRFPHPRSVPCAVTVQPRSASRPGSIPVARPSVAVSAVRSCGVRASVGHAWSPPVRASTRPHALDTPPTSETTAIAPPSARGIQRTTLYVGPVPASPLPSRSICCQPPPPGERTQAVLRAACGVDGLSQAPVQRMPPSSLTTKRPPSWNVCSTAGDRSRVCDTTNAFPLARAHVKTTSSCVRVAAHAASGGSLPAATTSTVPETRSTWTRSPLATTSAVPSRAGAPMRTARRMGGSSSRHAGCFGRSVGVGSAAGRASKSATRPPGSNPSAPDDVSIHSASSWVEGARATKTRAAGPRMRAVASVQWSPPSLVTSSWPPSTSAAARPSSSAATSRSPGGAMGSRLPVAGSNHPALARLGAHERRPGREGDRSHLRGQVHDRTQQAVERVARVESALRAEEEASAEPCGHPPRGLDRRVRDVTRGADLRSAQDEADPLEGHAGRVHRAAAGPSARSGAPGRPPRTAAGPRARARASVSAGGGGRVATRGVVAASGVHAASAPATAVTPCSSSPHPLDHTPEQRIPLRPPARSSREAEDPLVGRPHLPRHRRVPLEQRALGARLGRVVEPHAAREGGQARRTLLEQRDARSVGDAEALLEAAEEAPPLAQRRRRRRRRGTRTPRARPARPPSPSCARADRARAASGATAWRTRRRRSRRARASRRTGQATGRAARA